MSITSLKALFEERANAATELKAVYDAAEGRELTAEEVAKEERLHATITDRDAKIKAGLEAEEREAGIAESRSRFENLLDRKGQIKDETAPESRDLVTLRNLIQGGPRGAVEFRGQDGDVRESRVTLTRGTATDGAELVFGSFFRELYAYMRENASVLMTNARVISTADGNTITFPKVSSYPAAGIIDEGAQIGNSEPQFTTIALGAFKYAFLTDVSVELEQDELIGLASFLAQVGGEALGRGIGAHLISGNGSTQPNGIDNTANANNKAFTSATAITPDELLDVYHGIASPYRGRATWLMKDSTVKLIRKLKTATGEYLWQPGMAFGQPDTLFGRPLVTDDNMAAATAGQVSVIFGDMNGYITRLVRNVRLERSADFKFDYDLVTYKFVMRADGDIIDDNAIVKGTQA